MTHVGIVHTQMVKAVETSIKDDLAHTILHALPMHSIYALAALYKQDARRVSDLAHAVGTRPTSFTQVVDRLEVLGLIERYPHPIDRRSVMVRLTQEGKKYQAAVEQAIGNAEVRYGSK